MRYTLVFLTLLIKLLPPRLRGGNPSAWTQALSKPIQNLNDDFGNTVTETFYEISFTGQVIYLEHILNDLYDDPLRRIYIEDGLSFAPLPPYIYNKVEQRPIYIYNKSEGQPPVYVRNKIEYTSENDFIVYVPTAIYTVQLSNAITSVVNRYKIAGKRFSVIPI